ncbi:UDP-N-acetylmuramate dehydrogenase [Candidatus Parcubacteria bacterium]|nr:UDP-N-acetylmuramate dehydrogenase [Candidatus Parcubacteria bacterium]
MKSLKFKKNVQLKNYTTFKIGGPAKYFYIAKTANDLIKAIKAVKELGLDFFILGKGSNILAADKGYDGLVIKIQSPNYSKLFQIKTKFQNPKIYVEAGMPLSLLVSKTAEKGLTGMEWAIGIPGTVGGAIRGNAGAFEQSISDIVKKVKCLDIKNLESKTLKNKDCKFKYRDSIFKHKKNLIILSAEIEMKKGDKKEIRKRAMENLKWRKHNQPLDFPSAGSIFQNHKRHSAGWLIEQCGLKGKKAGKAQISKKHANFIVNLDNAKAEDVLKLINLAKKKVKQKFGIELKEEIEYLE